MMTCYLRDINKFLRYRTLCKSILKCRFPTKGIELIWFLIFEVLGVPQLWGTLFRLFWYVRYENLRNTNYGIRDYGIRNFSVLNKLVRFCICSQHRVFPSTVESIQAVREACTVVLREEVIIFSWCSCGLSLIEKNMKKWILSKRSSYIKK